ncbi:MAG TPA: hypothetical protein VHL34_22210 [Rhizomicrobium sp.]|nr:hypothetical protein [Rhizomicrobium sp.]
MAWATVPDEKTPWEYAFQLYVPWQLVFGLTLLWLFDPTVFTRLTGQRDPTGPADPEA